MSWWDLDGGLTGCLAAYQAKGAESEAASYVNLVNSGTHALSQPAAYPSWSAENGWDYSATGLRYLTIAGTMSWRTVVAFCFPVYASLSGLTSSLGQDANYFRMDLTANQFRAHSDSYYVYVNGVNTPVFTNSSWIVVSGVRVSAPTTDVQHSVGYSVNNGRKWSKYIGAIAYYDSAISAAQNTSLYTALLAEMSTGKFIKSNFSGNMQSLSGGF